MARLVEKLLVLNHKGVGLLIRLCHLKKELRDSKTSDLAFLRNEKVFANLAKSLQSFGKSISAFQPNSKLVEEIDKFKLKIAKHLSTPYDTVCDVFHFLPECKQVLLECANLMLDVSRASGVTKLFMDLFVLYFELIIVMSRMKELKTLCYVVKITGNTTSKDEYHQVCDFLHTNTKPLLTAYHDIKPLENVVKGTIFSSLCMAYTTQMSSGEQMRKEEFLSLKIFVPNDPNLSEVNASCFGYPLGLETLDLERLEKWLFYGFLLCHNVIDPTKKDSGEFKIWTLLLKGLWVLPIFRSEVVWVHESLISFFKHLKSEKTNKAKGKREFQETHLNKKANEMKVLLASALRSSPSYHFQRRMYLTSILSHFRPLIEERPELVQIRFIHLSKVLSLCKYEVHWLLRHQANSPTKKQEPSIMESLGLLQKGPEFLEVVHAMQEVRDLLLNKDDTIVRSYFRDYVATFDLPSLIAISTEEVAKINDPEIEKNPLQIALKTAQNWMDDLMVRNIDDNKECQEDQGNEIANSSLGINFDYLDADKGTDLKLDLLKLQACLINLPEENESIRPYRVPPVSLAKILDQTLFHLDVFLTTFRGQRKSYRLFHSLDPKTRLLIRNAKSNVSLAEYSDLSLLPLAFPEAMKAYFGLCFQPQCKEQAISLAFVELNGHFFESQHEMCPEDIEKSSKICKDNAIDFLRQICRNIFSSFRKWVEYHSSVTKTLLASENQDLALQVALKLAKKSAKHEDMAEVERLKRLAGQNSAKRGGSNSKSAETGSIVQMDSIFSSISQLTKALSRREEIQIGSLVFSPREFFFRALDLDFCDFLTKHVVLCQVDLDEVSSDIFPTSILAKLEDYFWCCTSLFHHVTSNDVDTASHHLRLRAKLQENDETLKTYMNTIFKQILQPIANKNCLVYSETLETFTLLPNAKLENEKLGHFLNLINRFISQSELEALCVLFGSKGVSHLIQDLIYDQGILPELNSLKITLDNAGRENCANVNLVLHHGIKCGVYLAIRNAILATLKAQNDNFMPYLTGVTELMQSYGLIEMAQVASLMGFSSTFLKEFDLSQRIQQESLFAKSDLDKFCHLLAMCIPHAARFNSSLFLPEMKTSQQQQANKTVCIDGHYNNLNCLSLTICHVLEAIFYATAQPEETVDDELRCFESFFSQFAKKLLHLSAELNPQVKGKQNLVPNLESLHLFAGLLVSNCPQLSYDILKANFPLPLHLVQKARNQKVSKGMKGLIQPNFENKLIPRSGDHFISVPFNLPGKTNDAPNVRRQVDLNPEKDNFLPLHASDEKIKSQHEEEQEHFYEELDMEEEDR